MEQESPAPPTERPSEEKTNPALDDVRKFIDSLAAMRDDSRGPSRRGQLAQLKRNIGEELPGRGISWFYGLLYEGDAKRRLSRQNEYFVIATLFDLNRFGSERSEDLGGAMRRATASGASEDGARRRLQILLDADFEDGPQSELAFRLRQAVQWLAGQKIGLNWPLLLLDVCAWSHPDRYVQKKWARSFYGVRLNQLAPQSSDVQPADARPTENSTN